MSLIDRLSLAGPDGAIDSLSLLNAARISPREAVRKYKESVKRDLEWLLNTRKTVDDRIDEYPLLATSIYAYGLPDISSVNVGSVKDQNALLQIMAKTLESFDNRLRGIEIEMDQFSGPARSLKFTISGVVLMDPAPEEITIDTVLEPNGKYEVK
jgi:type VI secretion system protein ImpF